MAGPLSVVCYIPKPQIIASGRHQVLPFCRRTPENLRAGVRVVEFAADEERISVRIRVVELTGGVALLLLYDLRKGDLLCVPAGGENLRRKADKQQCVVRTQRAREVLTYL